VTVDRTTDTAGAGSPAPAESSVRSGAGAPASVDVVAPEARTELDRIRRRWAELPLERAESRMPLLRHLLADLARRSAPGDGAVPDLGPAVVVDQLTVVVWDAYAAGRGDGIPGLLADLRRALG
jgi:hypothetical protein